MYRLAIALFGLCLCLAAHAETTITYQGQLQDSDGPANAEVDMDFGLYDEDEDGNLIAVDSQDDVVVTDGLFQVELDFGAGAFDGGERWLEVIVDGQTLDPRQRITPAPMALHAPGGGGDGSSPWGVEGDDIFYTDGNVGIGTTSPDYSLQVSGGMTSGYLGNVATGTNSFAAGGYSFIFPDPEFYPNTASGTASFVGGGGNNEAEGTGSFVAGGQENLAAGDASFAGGWRARAEHDGSFVWSGSDEFTDDEFASTGEDQFLIRAPGGVGIGTTSPSAQLHIQGSFIAGGGSPEASGIHSFVAGGRSNTAAGDHSFVSGFHSEATGSRSFATGVRARSLHDGTFVWADNTNENFTSTGEDQFLIRAGGGVGIGTNEPETQLHVADDARIEGELSFSDETEQRTAGPIAKGHVFFENGNLEFNGVNVENVTWESAGERFRIELTDITYRDEEFATVVTPTFRDVPYTGSVGGDLYVRLRGITDNFYFEAPFQFVVHELPDGAVTNTTNTASASRQETTADNRQANDLDMQINQREQRRYSRNQSTPPTRPHLQDLRAELKSERERVDKLQEKATELASLIERTDKLEAENTELREQVAANSKLAERNAELEERLARLESVLLEDRQVAEGTR